MQIEFQFKLVTDRSISKSDFSFLFKKSLSKSTLEVSHHSQPKFSKIKNKQFVFKENHFRIPHEKKDKLNPPIDFPRPDQRILIKELNLRSVLNVFISEISVNYFSQVFCRFFFSRRKYFDASKHEMSHNNLDKKIATHKN